MIPGKIRKSASSVPSHSSQPSCNEKHKAPGRGCAHTPHFTWFSSFTYSFIQGWYVYIPLPPPCLTDQAL